MRLWKNQGGAFSKPRHLVIQNGVPCSLFVLLCTGFLTQVSTTECFTFTSGSQVRKSALGRVLLWLRVAS